MKSENDIEKKTVKRRTGAYTGKYRDLQGVTGAYSGTQWMWTAASRRSQGVQGLCSVADMVCTGEDKGFSYEQGFLQPVV